VIYKCQRILKLKCINNDDSKQKQRIFRNILKRKVHSMPGTARQTSDKEQSAKDYLDSVYKKVAARDPHETEFLQATKMLFDSLLPVFVKNSTYMEHNILESLIEPERIITFREQWIDDEEMPQVIRGNRVQDISTIGYTISGYRYHLQVTLNYMHISAI